jgi:hypothetical protein
VSTPSRRPSRAAKAKAEPTPFADSSLAELGLQAGDAVRFRRSEGERWKSATVQRRERDGSLGLQDGKGASRAIAIELVEVRTKGPRGATVWEPVVERAARTEQMRLI